jgi:hypothetical protein
VFISEQFDQRMRWRAHNYYSLIGFVDLPPGSIKDEETVGECAQVFFIGDCQDGASKSFGCNRRIYSFLLLLKLKWHMPIQPWIIGKIKLLSGSS